MTPRETTPAQQAPHEDDESYATSSSVVSSSDYYEDDDSDVKNAAASPSDPNASAFSSSSSSHHQYHHESLSSPTTGVCSSSSSLLLSLLPQSPLPHRRPPSPRRTPLGLVFDLDGTLVAEPFHDDDPDAVYHSDSTFLRPGVQEFLRWCRRRGHVIAVWTAAQSAWAHYVSWKLTNACGNTASSTSNSSASSDDDDNENDDAQPDFAFVWDATKLRKRRRIPVDAHGLEPSSSSSSGGATSAAAAASSSVSTSCCCWCGPYRHVCDRCTCATYGVYTCPCRSTKDLRKVWRQQQLRSVGFVPHRTLLIENTPQQCLNNYGNAVYVPTYRGNIQNPLATTATDETTTPGTRHGIVDDVLIKLQALILQLEKVPDVRHASKCNCPTTNHHHHEQQQQGRRRRPHTCHEQCWWNTSTTTTCSPTASAATVTPAPPMDGVQP